MFEKNDLEDLVTVDGVVHLATSLGVFLETGGCRVFLPANCMAPSSRGLEAGQTVTVQIARRYAEQEGLVT
jgi:hypothetical protein